MSGLIFAILTCTTGSGGVCLDNYPIRFHSAQECLSFLTHNMAHGHELTNGRAYANGSHSVWFECDQKPTSEWQAVQPKPKPTQSELKSYTIGICPKNGDQCKQVLPAIHETIRDCALKLYDQTIGARPKDYDLDGGRIYLHGNRDVWMQCYDTTQ